MVNLASDQAILRCNLACESEGQAISSSRLGHWHCPACPRGTQLQQRRRGKQKAVIRAIMEGQNEENVTKGSSMEEEGGGGAGDAVVEGRGPAAKSDKEGGQDGITVIQPTSADNKDQMAEKRGVIDDGHQTAPLAKKKKGVSRLSILTSYCQNKLLLNH